MYTDSHEPEALDLTKILCKKSIVAAIYLLDYMLPQLAKLSRALQTESLDQCISGFSPGSRYSIFLK